MKLYKPTWINHDDKPIFSVDIHPDGKRFATGGQGNESGLVIIWNLAPVLSEKAESDKTVPKILCQMDNHISCVNSVRWSMNGQMLASGGDDKIVMIWAKQKGGGGGVFGSSGLTKTIESWKCISTLRGHGGDVLDLAWSPQDQWLASCSVDNHIIVWDVQSLPSIVARLKGHSGLVKGVTWDPVGKFLASQSDDRSVKIWKTSDWSCHNTIVEPFEECGGTTHVLRLSWSPDGQYLVSAHAMNGGGPTAQIIEREGWKCDKDFVGHRKAVTCVRFHNSILKRHAPKTNKLQQYCCVAIGSRDKSLSVWMTALQRPSVVIHDLFEDSILDLSWSSHGYILLACSIDGTVASLQFSAKELGIPLTEDDKNTLYQRMYGKNCSTDISNQVGKDMIIENAELLNFTNEKPKPPSLFSSTEQISNQIDNIIQIKSNSVMTKPINKQIETRTKDGKRRITPMFIPLATDVEEPPPEFSSSSRNTSNIVVEKMNENVGENITSTNTQNLQSDQLQEISQNTLVKFEKPQLDNRLKKPPPSGSIMSKDDKKQNTEQEQSQSKFDQVSIVSKSVAIAGGKAVPLKGTHIKAAGEIRISVLNGSLNTSFGPLSKIYSFHCNSPEKRIWEIFVGSPIVSVSCCLKYVLLCSIDGTVRFLDLKTGIIIIPVINLASAAVLSTFSLDSKLGGVLSECGSVKIWNIEEQSVFISTNCCDLLKSGYPQMMSITENGYPFISLSNGCSYTFSKKLDSWIVLNSRDPIFRHGLTLGSPNTPGSNIKNMKLYPLTTFQTTSHSFQPPNQNYIDGSGNSWQHYAKQAFIENQLELCKTINSSVELKNWYSMLGYHLSLHGTETRIRMLLDDLLGPVHSGSTLSENHKIFGIDKVVILKDILNNLRTQHQWQRLWMEYNEQLEILESNSVKMDET